MKIEAHTGDDHMTVAQYSTIDRGPAPQQEYFKKHMTTDASR